MDKEDSTSMQTRLDGLVIPEVRSIFSPAIAGGIQPQLATVARNGAHDGSPCKRFDPNHIHRRQLYSFFCLPGSNLRAWGWGHCVYRKPWAGPFGVWGVVHDQISPEGLKESSSVRHFAGVRGRFDCSSPGRLRVPSHQHKTDAVNKAPKPGRHSPARNAFNGVRGPVRPVSGRVLPGSRRGRAGYAAEEMCLPIFQGAINNTRAKNSQRGGGNRAAVGQRVLPDPGTGRAGQGLRGSLLSKRILGGSFLPGGSSRTPARGARVSNGNSIAHNKNSWGVGWLVFRANGPPGVQVLSNGFAPWELATLQRFSAGRFRKAVSPLSWFAGSFPTRATDGSGARCLFFYPQNKQLRLKRTPVNAGPPTRWKRRAGGCTGGIFGTVSYSLCPRVRVLPGIGLWSVFHARNNFFAHNRQLLESNSNSNQAPRFGSFVRGLEFSAIPDTDRARHSKQMKGIVRGPNMLGPMTPQNRLLVACAFPQNRRDLKRGRSVSVHNRTVLYKESIDTHSGPIRI